MSMFRIPAYDTTAIGDGFIDVSVRDWQPLSIRAYILMRKSLALADRLEKRDPQGIEPKHRRKAAVKLKQAGATRWITIHPPDGDKGRPGVPVMIREKGDGTAHVVGGAGGRLNMLKLRGIKSPEEYHARLQRRKAEERERAGRASETGGRDRGRIREKGRCREARQAGEDGTPIGTRLSAIAGLASS